ncbi:FCD domain-containing protein [Rhodococcus sp. AW25M09]|uniref:FCD domain-containing protein n=1 Tax=Rhodococcus sp. AW25M09 TaxID=1268303 RepID=UPI0009DB6C8D|nr:FCD domain-containing protein [Rhodococcus sp. AW25M09]
MGNLRSHIGEDVVGYVGIQHVHRPTIDAVGRTGNHRRLVPDVVDSRADPRARRPAVRSAPTLWIPSSDRRRIYESGEPIQRPQRYASDNLGRGGTRDSSSRVSASARRAGERRRGRPLPASYYYANARFHGIINDSCGNDYLRQQAYALERILQPYRRLQVRVPDRMRRSMAEHRIIADAIARGDAAAAETAARDHVLVQVKEFSNLVRIWNQLSAS